MTMLLSRFSVNSAAATEPRSVWRVAAERLFVAANKRNQGLQSLLFDRSITSSAICLWESATQRIAPAGSAGSIYRPVVELRL
jgi:hypothetical protein